MSSAFYKGAFAILPALSVAKGVLLRHIDRFRRPETRSHAIDPKHAHRPDPTRRRDKPVTTQGAFTTTAQLPRLERCRLEVSKVDETTLALGPVPGATGDSSVPGPSPCADKLECRSPSCSTARMLFRPRSTCSSSLPCRVASSRSALVPRLPPIPSYIPSLRSPSNTKGAETEEFPPLLRYRLEASTKTNLAAQQHESRREWTSRIRFAKPPSNRRPNEDGGHGRRPRPLALDNNPSTPCLLAAPALALPQPSG